MSVARYDLDLCIGCQNCMEICPMDVFRYNADAGKSVIAYPENCQSCGQCYLYCPVGALQIVNNLFAYSIPNYRSTNTAYGPVAADEPEESSGGWG